MLYEDDSLKTIAAHFQFHLIHYHMKQHALFIWNVRYILLLISCSRAHSPNQYSPTPLEMLSRLKFIASHIDYMWMSKIKYVADRFWLERRLPYTVYETSCVKLSDSLYWLLECVKQLRVWYIEHYQAFLLFLCTTCISCKFPIYLSLSRKLNGGSVKNGIERICPHDNK